MQKVVFILLLVGIVAISGCTDQNSTNPQPNKTTQTNTVTGNGLPPSSNEPLPERPVNQTSETIKPRPNLNSLTNNSNPEQVTSESAIKSGSIAIFYRATLDAVKNKLKGFQRTSHDGALYETGFDINLNVESTDKAVLRYIPSVEWFDIMGTTTSYSYSTSSISPYTIDGRLFTIVSRSTVTTINEIDPKTAKLKGSVSLQGGTSSYAIVGNDVYYRIKESTDFYGKHSGGGQLMKQSLLGGSPEEILPYGDPDNSGRLYSAGNNLVSVVYNDSSLQTDTIFLHDTATGKVTKTLYTGVPTGLYLSADDALYELSLIDNVYWITRYPVEGEPTTLPLELETGESGLSIDAENGVVLIVTYNDSNVVSVQSYDMVNGGSLRSVNIEPFGSSYSKDSYQFVFLE
jgi:hypothetical protein